MVLVLQNHWEKKGVTGVTGCWIPVIKGSLAAAERERRWNSLSASLVPPRSVVEANERSQQLTNGRITKDLHTSEMKFRIFPTGPEPQSANRKTKTSCEKKITDDHLIYKNKDNASCLFLPFLYTYFYMLITSLSVF